MPLPTPRSAFRNGDARLRTALAARRNGGPPLAVRAARASVARVRRAVDHAVARSPQSLFLRELVTQPGTVGAICASSPRLAARMAAWVDTAAPGVVVELGGGTGVITAALLAQVEVRVKKKTKRGGRLEQAGELAIAFGSLDELNGLIERLRGA